MYRLLLVDDERIIREGIIRTVDWESLDISVREARDGLEAFEIISRDVPDIVITDIKMPGMNGLELIEKAGDIVPDLTFAVLSGYNDFQFAHEAMKFGVRHYLLKPSRPAEISNMLKSIVMDIKGKRDASKNIQRMKNSLERITLKVRKQFLYDLVLNSRLSEEERSDIHEFIGIEELPLSLILFEPDEKHSYNSCLSLMEIVEEKLAEEERFTPSRVCLCTVIENALLTLISPAKKTELIQFVTEVQERYAREGGQLSAAIGDEDGASSIGLQYEKLRHELKLRCSPQSIITYDYSRNTPIIRKVLEYTYRNYGDESLSISWIARNIVFLNEDYLGKLFKKETGRSFNSFLISLRMERAKQLMENDRECKISEAAQAIGLGRNPQYFAILFKKHIGFTPSDFKKRLLSEP